MRLCTEDFKMSSIHARMNLHNMFHVWRHGGTVDSIVNSQLPGSRFDSEPVLLSVWGFGVLGVWPVYIGLGEGNNFLFCNNWCLCCFSSFHKELAKMCN